MLVWVLSVCLFVRSKLVTPSTDLPQTLIEELGKISGI